MNDAPEYEIDSELLETLRNMAPMLIGMAPMTGMVDRTFDPDQAVQVVNEIVDRIASQCTQLAIVAYPRDPNETSRVLIRLNISDASGQ